jgi:hypothetical protein
MGVRGLGGRFFDGWVWEREGRSTPAKSFLGVLIGETGEFQWIWGQWEMVGRD